MDDFTQKKISQLSWFTARDVNKFKKKDLETVADLIFYLPRKYEDRSNITKVQTALAQSEKDRTFISTIICECTSVEKFPFKGRDVNKYFFSDGETVFSLVAFNPSHRFSPNRHYIISGRLNRKFGEIQMILHEWEIFDEEALQSLHMGRIVPIYSMIEGISQKRLRTSIKKILESKEFAAFDYQLPLEIIKKRKMQKKALNLWRMHFPETLEQLEKARSELAYEEFFIIQNQLALKKKQNYEGKEKIRYQDTAKANEIIAKWPYVLTDEQNKAIENIFSDMTSPCAMNRMLQGEVGSGKTLVALAAMTLAATNQKQAAFMAPTDVLAKQHYQSFCDLVKNQGIEVYLLVAQQTQKERRECLKALSSEKGLIVVGTHALIQKTVSFNHLSLVIIDEQHRFGVEQREELKKKGNKVDFLSLSATPIPRSLSLTLFGDQDRSELHKRPAAKAEIKSKVIFEEERPDAYRFMLKRISEGEQGYVVFPVIEESEKLKSLMKEYKNLKTYVFKSFPTAFIHGRMNVDQRDLLMEQFRKKIIKVLFCTTVLEVGIDHPNATVMIVESAHQFGLSQLHQLRGRVGRHEKPGFCYLATKHSVAEESIERLKNFCQVTDGFKIAELDLQIRGPGELVGSRQSGFLEFRFADLRKDFPLLLSAREDAYAQVFQ